MAYTAEQAQNLSAQFNEIWMDLLRVQAAFVHEAENLTPEKGKEFVQFGVGRRLYLITMTLRNIFRIFPPERTKVLTFAESADVQINLHAFIINLAGFFDNAAWAFVLRHSLIAEVGDPRKVGLFLTSTSKFLPKLICEALAAADMQNWQQRYLKDYRDALAHRIPLYLPPAEASPEEARRISTLEVEKMDALRSFNLPRFEALEAEQATLGKPCFFFLHATGPENPSQPVWLHPQILADAKGVLEFGRLFLEHWHDRTSPPDTRDGARPEAIQ